MPQIVKEREKRPRKLPPDFDLVSSSAIAIGWILDEASRRKTFVRLNIFSLLA
jgi:hypothetical protein